MTELLKQFEKPLGLIGDKRGLYELKNYREILYIRFYLAMTYQRSGKPDLAKPHLQFLQEIANDSPNALDSEPQPDPPAAVALAFTLL